MQEIYWVDDGREQIAIALEKRAKRYYPHGIRARCQYVTQGYLQGKVPLRPGDVVINFGANIGEVAMTLARDCGVKVLAIEPDPRHWAPLHYNTRAYDVEIVPVAGWNVDGPLKLYLDNRDSADTSIHNETDDCMTIMGQTIDTLVKARGIKHVRLIVGDAQGAEPEVIDGARETLKNTDYVSVRASAERCGERTLEACDAILEEARFNIIHREETKFCTLIGRNRFINYDDVADEIGLDRPAA